MKVLVVGSGGREHAIIKKIKENKNVETIYAYPGNGGMKDDAVLVSGSATDIEGVVSFAKANKVDYVVVTPDDPLVLGMVDALEKEGIPCFGPKKNAAIIEGSKVFSKNLMKKYGIPTAAYEVFDDVNKALAYVEKCPIPTVVKADGLALGKGVVIAMTREEANLYAMGFKQKIYSRIWDLACKYKYSTGSNDIPNSTYIEICSDIMRNIVVNIDRDAYEAEQEYYEQLGSNEEDEESSDESN